MTQSVLEQFSKEVETFVAEDFRPMRLEARLQDVAKINGTLVEILEYHGKQLVVDAPSRFTAVGQTLLLSILLQDLHPFAATARTLSVERLGERRARIALELVQFDKKSLQEIERTLLARQERISEFLQAAKGF